MLVDGQAGSNAGDASFSVGPAGTFLIFLGGEGGVFFSVLRNEGRKRTRNKTKKTKTSSPEPERPGPDPGLVRRDHPFVDVLVAGDESGEEDAVAAFWDGGGRERVEEGLRW